MLIPDPDLCTVVMSENILTLRKKYLSVQGFRGTKPATYTHMAQGKMN